MSICQAFNNVLIDFINDCILVFPEDNDFKKYKHGAEILKKYNPKKIPTIFKQYIQNYIPKISSKDEKFFLENDYSEIDIVNQDNELIELIKKIKIYWVNLSDENKDKIWSYLNILIQLSNKL